MQTNHLDALAIETLARKAYEDACNFYPMGCDEDQMREFLRTQSPYPLISWHIAMGHTEKWTELIAEELKKTHG